MTTLTRAQQALVDYIEQQLGNQSLGNLIRNGKLRFDPFVLYVRALIEGDSGLKKYLKVDTAREVGITNIDKGRLPDDEIACFSGINIGYAKPDGVTDPAKVVTFSTDTGAMAAALRNGEFFVNQSGGEILRLPVGVLGTNADSDWASGRADAHQLEQPLILEDKRGFELGVEYANDETITSGTTLKAHVEIKLFGVKLKYKGRG